MENPDTWLTKIPRVLRWEIGSTNGYIAQLLMPTFRQS